MSKGIKGIDVNEKVTCFNPATGQTMQTTAKVFHSIYIDKGFELVTRNNVDDVSQPRQRATGGKSRSEHASNLGEGSAARVANVLGLGNGDPGQDPPATRDNTTMQDIADETRAGRVNGEGRPGLADEKETEAAVDAGKGVEGSEGNAKNASEVNVDKPVISDERQSNAATRGRNK